MTRDHDREPSPSAPRAGGVEVAAWLAQRGAAVAACWERRILSFEPGTAHTRPLSVIRVLGTLLEAIPEPGRDEGFYGLRQWIEATADPTALVPLGEGVAPSVLAHDLGVLRSCLLEDAAAAGVLAVATPFVDAAIDVTLAVTLRHREEAHARQLAALERLASVTRDGQPLDAFLLELLRIFVGEVPGVDSAAIWLVREGELVLRAAVGAPPGLGPGSRMATAEGLPAALLGASVPVEEADFAAAWREGFPSVPPRTRGFFGQPLWHDGLALGLGHFGSRTSFGVRPGAKSLFATLIARATAAAAEEELRTRLSAAQAGESIASLRLRAVLDRLPVGVVIADAEGAIVQANPAADRIWGTSIRRLDPVPRSAPRFRAYLPVTCEPCEWGLAVALASGATVEGRELEIVGFDGHGRTVLESSSPLLDERGALRGALAIDQDITALRRTESERRLVGEVGQRLAESLDTRTTVTQIARLVIPDFADWSAVATFDEEGGPVLQALESADPAKRDVARRILDTYRIDIAAAHGVGRVIRTGEPELVPEVSPAFLDSLGPIPLREVLLRLEATSYLSVPMVARGRIVGAVYMAMAGSGRRYSAANLELGNELASLAGLALDNARLLREAREAVRAREEFLSLASHELRTPLTTVLTQIQLAERLLGDGIEPRVRLALERAERQGQRLRKMVNDVLSLAQFVSGDLRVLPEAMDLAQTSRDVVGGLSAATGLPVPQVGVSGPPTVRGRWDRLRLRQAILALLDNALVYGHGQPIDVAIEDRGAAVRWSVRDRGPGVGPADRVHLFQPFHRGAHPGGIRGLGLGLFIARRIVEAHGGRIGYEGEPGRDSTFWFELPLDSAPFARRQEETGPSAVVG